MRIGSAQALLKRAIEDQVEVMMATESNEDFSWLKVSIAQVNYLPTNHEQNKHID